MDKQIVPFHNNEIGEQKFHDHENPTAFRRS